MNVKFRALQGSSDDETEINELRGLESHVNPSSSSCSRLQNGVGKNLLTPNRTSRIQKQSPCLAMTSSVKNDATRNSEKAPIGEEIPSYDIVTPLTDKITLVPQTAQSIVQETPQSLWWKKALPSPISHGPAYDTKSHSRALRNKLDQTYSETSSSSQQEFIEPNSKDDFDEMQLSTHDISTPVKFEPISIVASETLEENTKGINNRCALTPSIGSVIMKNSTGITSMLRKRKRQDPLMKPVPENDRIFTGRIFLYIPTDDIAPLRRKRIAKARSYGAVWTKEWSSTVTHVVVDKSLNYSQVMAYLKPIMNLDSLPSNVILVNDEYPNECVNFRCLLDPYQKRYTVSGLEGQQKPTDLKTFNISSRKSDRLSTKNMNSSKFEDMILAIIKKLNLKLNQIVTVDLVISSSLRVRPEAAGATPQKPSD